MEKSENIALETKRKNAFYKLWETVAIKMDEDAIHYPTRHTYKKLEKIYLDSPTIKTK